MYTSIVYLIKTKISMNIFMMVWDTVEDLERLK